MAVFKEIVTKAIVGKGKKYFKNNYSIKADDNPSTVLGCWVINHKFKGYKSGDKIGVDGSYDVNIWYSYDNDSKTTVINKKVMLNVNKVKLFSSDNKEKQEYKEVAINATKSIFEKLEATDEAKAVKKEDLIEQINNKNAKEET